LHDVQLIADPGQRIALVGPTGAGKSSIINLLCRFYDPQGGAVLVDGHNLREVTLKSLREQLGIVLQDTFLSIWRKLDTFKGDAQFGSWLYRVAANTALMRLRAQRRHPEISTEELPVGYLDNYGQVPPPGENWAKRPDDELQSDELRRHIQSAVDALPEIYRTVFLLRDVEGLSTEETGEILGISVPTVKTRLHRARIALRDTISSYFNKK
jgi:RNA polymerase sigma-70 factor (ECF subfamily)